MYWTDIDHSFCEESLTGLPEYFNAVSSLFIVFFGLHGLINLYNELFIDILYANLTIVGFGSVGYHWYGNIGWGLFDEIPMILAIFTGIIYADNVHFYMQKQIYENEWDLTTQLVYKKKGKLLLYLFTMSFVTIINVMSNFRKAFPIVFTCVAIYLYYKIFLLLQILNSPIKIQVMSKVYNSLFTIAVSGSVWITTEISCKYVKYNIFLLGHPMWHFFIGHGFYNLIQAVYFIKLNNLANKLKYNSIYLLYINRGNERELDNL